MDSFLSYIKKTVQRQSLKIRMQELLDVYNGETLDNFTPYIVSLKSKEILEYINFPKNNINEQIDTWRQYNTILQTVIRESYNRFNPTMMYAFNDELHFVFYNTSDYMDVYNGNIVRIMTTINSFVTRSFTREFSKYGIDFEFSFNAKYAQFPVEYETLNYLVWRQLDCKRNNTITLFKYFNNNTTHMNLEDVTQNLCHNLKDNNINYTDLSDIIYGYIVKKEIVYIEKGDDIVTRKVFNISNTILNDNFRETLHKYVYVNYL
jgi:hypothetical protein